MFKKVNKLWINTLSSLCEFRECDDGSLQIFYYNREETEVQLTLNKYGKLDYLISPNILEKKIQMVITIRRTSEHYYQIIALTNKSSQIYTAKGYEGINRTLNNIYYNY